MRLKANGVVRDAGQFEQAIPGAAQHSVEELPEETPVEEVPEGEDVPEEEVMSPEEANTDDTVDNEEHDD